MLKNLLYSTVTHCATVVALADPVGKALRFINSNNNNYINQQRKQLNQQGQRRNSFLKPLHGGLHLLSSVTWSVRLGLLLAPCDTSAEESPEIRQAIREAELSKPDLSVINMSSTNCESVSILI